MTARLTAPPPRDYDEPTRDSSLGISAMTQPRSPHSDSPSHDSLEQQAQQRQQGLISEFFDFIRHNKKWWLTPIIAVLLLLGVLILLGGTGAAPFIYTLF